MPRRFLPGMRAVLLVLLSGSFAACTHQPSLPELACAPADAVIEDAVPAVGEQPPAEAPRALPTDLQLAQAAFDRGDHAVALQTWEKVLAAEPSVGDGVRARLGIMLLRLSPSSALADRRAAGTLLAELEREVRDNGLYDEFALDMALLRALMSQESEITKLAESNQALRAELAAREALIRKLRELSSGRD